MVKFEDQSNQTKQSDVQDLKQRLCKDCVYCYKIKQIDRCSFNPFETGKAQEPKVTVKRMCELGLVQNIIDGISDDTHACTMFSDIIRDFEVIMKARASSMCSQPNFIAYDPIHNAQQPFSSLNSPIPNFGYNATHYGTPVNMPHSAEPMPFTNPGGKK